MTRALRFETPWVYRSEPNGPNALGGWTHRECAGQRGARASGMVGAAYTVMTIAVV